MIEEEKAIEEATYYDETGNVTEEFKTALAYHKNKSHYVREFKTQLYTKGTIVKSNDRCRYKWRKVGPKCYRNYIKYLSTNQEYCYNLANRNRDE